jgi:hypothetical protein
MILADTFSVSGRPFIHAITVSNRLRRCRQIDRRRHRVRAKLMNRWAIRPANALYRIDTGDADGNMMVVKFLLQKSV